MQKRAFINRIRSLFNIDGYTLPELTREQQLEFLRDPVRYFLNTDEAQSDAIMREVESRQKGEVFRRLDLSRRRPAQPRASRRNWRPKGN